MNLLDTAVIKLNGIVNCLFGKGCRAENILLLLPHCLQFNECNVNVVKNSALCRRCGKCPLGELVSISEDLGIKHAVVAGGRKAVEICKSPDVETVIAVACSKELRQGIMAVFPKKVIPVTLTQPQGPCRNTCVDPQNVRNAVSALIESS